MSDPRSDVREAIFRARDRAVQWSRENPFHVEANYDRWNAALKWFDELTEPAAPATSPADGTRE